MRTVGLYLFRRQIIGPIKCGQFCAAEWRPKKATGFRWPSGRQRKCALETVPRFQWTKPNVVHTSEEMGAVDKLWYLNSFISLDGFTSDEVFSSIYRSSLAFDKVRPLWSRHDIGLPIKGRVSVAVERSILFCGSETGPLKKEVRRHFCVWK